MFFVLFLIILPEYIENKVVFRKKSKRRSHNV